MEATKPAGQDFRVNVIDLLARKPKSVQRKTLNPKTVRIRVKKSLETSSYKLLLDRRIDVLGGIGGSVVDSATDRTAPLYHCEVFRSGPLCAADGANLGGREERV